MDARPALQPNIIEGSSFLGMREAKPGRWWTGIISSLALVAEYLRIKPTNVLPDIPLLLQEKIL